MYSAAKWRSENAAKNQFQRASRTLKNVSTRGHSKRMTEAYFSLYAAVLERCENEAEDIFQRSENKKSPRPGKTLRIAPASSSSPVPQPRGNDGQFSEQVFWLMVHPTPRPSHLKREEVNVRRKGSSTSLASYFAFHSSGQWHDGFRPH